MSSKGIINNLSLRIIIIIYIIVHDDPDADSSMFSESLDYHMVACTFRIRKFATFPVLIIIAMRIILSNDAYFIGMRKLKIQDFIITYDVRYIATHMYDGHRNIIIVEYCRYPDQQVYSFVTRLKHFFLLVKQIRNSRRKKQQIPRICVRYSLV